MKPITRREFLRAAAAGMGLLALEQVLAACGQQELIAIPLEPSLNPPRPTDTSTVRAQAEVTRTEVTAAEVHPAATDKPATPSIPDLVVARSGEPQDLVRRALAALGGMQSFMSIGANVIIKPNICVAYHSYEYAATTNPFVVGALVKTCLEAGAASVKVMDGPFGGTPQQAYDISGIQEQVHSAGGEMVVMSNIKYKEVKIPEARKLKKVKVFDDLLKADLVIDVPIAKHHSLAGLTLGMKNLMGVIQNRSALHGNLGQNLADLTSLIRPKLTIIDAVRILTANGPTGGNLDDVRKLDTLIVSTDIVAADSYAATLFGKRPEDFSFIQAGTEMGLGRSDLSQLKIEEINIGG
jgi:uncharacterized protein (DUF362 family)